MEKSFSSLRMEDGSFFAENSASFKCNGCKVVFQKPILATVSSSGNSQTYYACPRCLSKVGDVDHVEDEKKDGSFERTKSFSIAKDENNVKCNHFIGYLKKHPKEMPFPEECLMCSKMIDCMIH